jgi:hypothetical protein
LSPITSEATVTDLQRAKEFLRVSQKALADARTYSVQIDVYETRVLAALSWVWEEQERAQREILWPCRDGRKIAIGDMGRNHIMCCLALMNKKPGWRKKFFAPMQAELARRGNP